MRSSGRLILACVGLLSCLPVHGQEKKAGEYILAPDDVILISVPGYDLFSQKMFVTRDGRIALPEIGAVMAAGKTARELEKDLQAKIEKVRNNVSVSVLLLETASRRVLIIGAVKVQGPLIMRSGWKLLDLIGAAGGLTAKPELIGAKLVRNNQTVDLNYQEANDKPESEANIALAPDDTIVLNERERVHWFVTVTGEVAKKGVVDLTPETDVSRLVNMAGPTELSDLSQAHVLRGNDVIPINLESVALAKPDEKVQSFRLKNGDTLFIPMIKTKFSVLGAVGRPGVFPLPGTRTVKVLDAFNLAGGGPQADLTRAGIVRLEGTEYKIIKTNIEIMLKKGDMSGNIPVKDGDILYIPAKGRGGFKLEDLLTPLYLFRYLIP